MLYVLLFSTTAQLTLVSVITHFFSAPKFKAKQQVKVILRSVIVIIIIIVIIRNSFYVRCIDSKLAV
jgi:hypothetical protein